MTEAPAHVMLDLETLGTSPGAPILSIGAVRFRMDDQPIGEEDMFYQAISLESCMDLGLRPNANTIIWWMSQSDEAKRVFNDIEAVPLPMALDMFTTWMGSRPDEVWGNSARFDCGLLETAYKACGKEAPWAFWRERCYRTVKNLPGAEFVPFERAGTHHNALDDAYTQAIHLREIFKKLKLGAA